ncbi:MAG: hypothetical protein R2743_22445 [Ilumatobacteraceae bacterium]
MTLTPHLTLAVTASLLVASAVVALVNGLRPRRRTIAEVRSILQPSSHHGVVPSASLHRRAGLLPPPAGGTGVRARAADLGGRVTRPVAGAVERAFGDGLALAGTTPHDVATRTVVAAIALAFVALCGIGTLMSTGALPASPWWAAVVLAAGAAGAVVMIGDVRTKVHEARRAFRRASTDFVQLVAVGLTTDQSVEAAVAFALDVGDSEMFALLRDEIERAPMRGVPLWEAIDRIGRTHQQRELCEFAGSIERQGTQGVSITDTVHSLATAMRAKGLDELERDADRANANLSGPTIGFVVATVVFLAYPLAVRIGEAFGG